MSDALLVAIVGVLSAVLGSGGMWTFLTRRAEVEEKEIDRLRADIKELRDKVEGSEATVTRLQSQIAMMELHHGSYLPRWIKDSRKRLVWLNDRAFLAIFAPLNLSRDAVIGKTFHELLDEGAANEIDRLDQVALAHPEMAASNLVQLHPMLPLMVIVKVAAVGRDGELVYEGYAYRPNDRMMSDGIGAGRQAEAIGMAAERMVGKVE